MTTSIEKLPALSALYRELDIPMQLVDGWRMPARFSSVSEESLALTERAGLVDISYLRKLDIKGDDTSSIPALPEGVDFWQLSPRHALLTSSDRDLTNGMQVSTVDVTSAFAAFALIGPRSRIVLQHLAAFDVSDRALPDRACGQSKAAEVHVTICRKDIQELPQFLLFIGRDVAESFRESILHAGHAIGLEPCGQAAYDSLRQGIPGS